MKSLLPPERVLVPLIVQAQNGINITQTIHTILKMVNSYLVHIATNVKYRFNGSCPVVGADDLVQKARIILVERIIPDWSIKQGSFTNYLTKTIRLEMFHMLNGESKKSKLVSPLQAINFEGSDEPTNYEEWSLRHSKRKGQMPPQSTDYGLLLSELKYTLKKSVAPENPIAARAIQHELKNGGHCTMKELALHFNVPPSTIARKIKTAVEKLREELI